MTNVDTYLDRVCGRLRVDPAQADDIRAELRSHLEEFIGTCRAKDMDEGEAAELAISSLGDAAKLHSCLDRVHQGDAWWVLRLKGLALGTGLGGLLALLMPVGGHAEFLSGLFWFAAGIDAGRAQVLVNALILGGLIGLLSAGGRALLVGWSMGSLVWLAEHVVYWIAGTVSNGFSPEQGLNVFHSVLLSPVVGGLFGAVVAMGTGALLSLTSRLRPEIR